MAVLNPLQALIMLKNNPPQKVAEEIIRNNFPNDPTIGKLLELGNNGDVASLEKIANELLSPQGKSLPNELTALRSAISNL
jgi:hypothetical protein